MSTTGPTGNGASDGPTVSADGRCVAFQSAASDLVANDVNGLGDVFLRVSGATELVSRAAGGGASNGHSWDPRGPSMSDDCRDVAFSSRASNLGPPDLNAETDIFVRDRTTGVNQLVSLRPDGSPFTRGCSSPSMSADGRFVAFDDALDPLLSGAAVYLRDRVGNVTIQVSLPTHGAAGARRPALSADGRFVAYMTFLKGSVPGDIYDDRVWLFDRISGTTQEVAVAGGADDVLDLAGFPSIDGTGDLVAFGSSRALVPYDTDRTVDTYLYRRTTGEVALLTNPSVASLATWRALSRDGRFTALQDGNMRLVDLETGIEATPSGVYQPALSEHGQTLVAVATAPVDPADVNGAADVLRVNLDIDTDGMPNSWESAFGLDATDPTDATADADGDGLSNIQEFEAGTHPRGTVHRYLAEGATSSFFRTRLALAYHGATSAHVLLEFQRATGPPIHHYVRVDADTRSTLRVEQLPWLATAEFSVLVESDEPVVVDRTMVWDASGYGGHAETASTAPGVEWHLAEGATHSGFELFYLVQNPADAAADIEVTFLRPAPQLPVVRTYLVPPRTRLTIWVDLVSQELVNTDLSATIRSTNGVPVLVERAMYLSRPGQLFAAGHAASALPAPATTWFLAEGATGPFFDCFVLVANPGSTDADLTLTYLLPDGSTVVRAHRAPARSRITVWVDYEHPALAETAVSIVVAASAPVVVERAMWWPGSFASWHEAHASGAVTHPSARWMLAEGEASADLGADTFVLVANTSDAPVTVRVTCVAESGAIASRELELPPLSRRTIWTNVELPSLAGQRFWTLVQAIDPSQASLIVERAMYWDSGGVRWAAGTGAVATPLP